MRAIIAIDGSASVTAGRTRCARRPDAAHRQPAAARTRRRRSGPGPSRTPAWTARTASRAARRASKSELGQTAETMPATTPTTAASTSAATVSSSVAGHASASSSTTGRFCWMERPRSPVRHPADVPQRSARAAACRAPGGRGAWRRPPGVACSPSMRATGVARDELHGQHDHEDARRAAPGTARSSRRTMNVSMTVAPRRGHGARGVYLSSQVFQRPRLYSTGWMMKPLTLGPGDDDLLGVVDRDPHHLLGEDVLDLAVELLALRLVQAAARLLHAAGPPAGSRSASVFQPVGGTCFSGTSAYSE